MPPPVAVHAVVFGARCAARNATASGYGFVPVVLVVRRDREDVLGRLALDRQVHLRVDRPRHPLGGVVSHRAGPAPGHRRQIDLRRGAGRARPGRASPRGASPRGALPPPCWVPARAGSGGRRSQRPRTPAGPRALPRQLPATPRFPAAPGARRRPVPAAPVPVPRGAASLPCHSSRFPAAADAGGARWFRRRRSSPPAARGRSRLPSLYSRRPGSARGTEDTTSPIAKSGCVHGSKHPSTKTSKTAVHRPAPRHCKGRRPVLLYTRWREACVFHGALPLLGGLVALACGPGTPLRIGDGGGAKRRAPRRAHASSSATRTPQGSAEVSGAGGGRPGAARHVPGVRGARPAAAGHRRRHPQASRGSERAPELGRDRRREGIPAEGWVKPHAPGCCRSPGPSAAGAITCSSPTTRRRGSSSTGGYASAEPVQDTWGLERQLGSLDEAWP